MISLVHGTRFIIIGTCSKNGTYFFLELHSYFMIPWDSPRLNVSIYTPYILIYYHAGIDSGDEVLEKIYTIIHTPEGYLYGRASIFAGSNPSTTKPLHYRRVHLQTTIEKISAKILTQFEKLLTWTWKLFWGAVFWVNREAIFSQKASTCMEIAQKVLQWSHQLAETSLVENGARYEKLFTWRCWIYGLIPWKLENFLDCEGDLLRISRWILSSTFRCTSCLWSSLGAIPTGWKFHFSAHWFQAVSAAFRENLSSLDARSPEGGRVRRPMMARSRGIYLDSISPELRLLKPSTLKVRLSATQKFRTKIQHSIWRPRRSWPAMRT